jgi:hypothetical protein
VATDRRKEAVLRFARRQMNRLDARVNTVLHRFSEAEANISRLILQGLLSGNLKSARERNRRIAEANRILRQAFLEADKEIPDLVLDHFKVGQQVAEIGTDERIKMSRVQREMLRLLTENLVEDLGSARDTVGRRVADVFRKEGLRAAIEATRTDDIITPAATMSRNLQRDGITSFVDSANRRWTLSHYTSMAVKTTTSQAQNTATNLILVEKGFDVVEINSVLSPCVDCKEFDGKEFSLTGRETDLPRLEKTPPFHPSCRHFMFPNSRSVVERASVLLPGTTTEAA